MRDLKIYEEIIYQHLLREFIERSKALKKDYLLSGRNCRVAKIFLVSVAKQYIFKPISIEKVVEQFDQKMKR